MRTASALVALWVVALLAPSAAAQLTEADLFAVGDARLTRDAASGLEWLDLPLTAGQSWADVEAGFGDFTTVHGFRFAIRSEVRTLFENAGIDDPDGVWRSSYFDLVDDLLDLLGCTYCVPSSPYFWAGADYNTPRADRMRSPWVRIRFNPSQGVAELRSSNYKTTTNPRHAFYLVRTTAASTCGNGAIEGYEQCDDGNTVDGDCCSATCLFEAEGSSCSDDDACTVTDACDAAGACISGSARDCDDENVCTTDSCDTALGCQYANNTNTCDDENACTTGEVCSGGSCGGGTAVDCDDGEVCTTDSCDTALGCQYANNTNTCDDENACTTGEVCSGGSCGGGTAVDCDDGELCTTDSCDTALGCQYANNTNPCDDENACTTGDVCAGGSCQPGTGPPLTCHDGNECTDDACDPETGCTFTNNTDPCEDGDACTTGDICGGGTCQAGSPLTCDDSEVCTDDSCDSQQGCVYTPNTDPCDDNDACTTADVCSGGACIGGSPPDCDDSNPCTDDGCDTIAGCEWTDNTDPCDDGNACTETDTCSAGSCVGGAPPDCDDLNVCTDDSCDTLLGCVYADNTDPCDDGDACTTVDVCSGGACGGSVPPNCDDGLFCNGVEVCDSPSGCALGPPLDLSDGIDCTVDTCDEPTDTIIHTPSDILCSDGDACTTDQCSASMGCSNPVIPLCGTPLVSGDIVLAQTNRLMRVDPVTGDRQLISEPGVLGSGPTFGQADVIAIEPGGTFVVGSPSHDWVIRIDPTTSNSELVTDPTIGGADTLERVYAIAVAPDGTIYTTERVHPDWAIWKIDPVTGAQEVVASQSVGTGPSVIGSWGLVVEPDGGLLISTNGVLLRMDPVTLEREYVSGQSSTQPGTGPDFGIGENLALAPDGGVWVAGNGTEDGPVHVDVVTGNRRLLFTGTMDRVAVASDGLLYGGEQAFGDVFSVHPTNFETQDLDGTGPLIAGDFGIVVVPDPAPPLVPVCGDDVVEYYEECDDGGREDGDCCSYFCGFEPVDSNCEDGLHCSYSDDCDGAGTCLSGPFIENCPAKPGGGDVVGIGSAQLWHLDSTTLERSHISWTGAIGEGTSLWSATDLDIEADGGIIVGGRLPSVMGILRVNPYSGDVSVVSDAVTGGGAVLGDHLGIAVAPDGFIWVGDDENDRILRVDPVTGFREIMSDNGDPGPNIHQPRGLAVDATGTVWMAMHGGPSAGALRIDASTGERIEVSTNAVGAGPNFSGVNDIDVHPVTGDVYVADGTDGLFHVDPATGTRMIVSGSTGLDAVEIDENGVIFASNVAQWSVWKIHPVTGVRTLLAELSGPGPGPALIPHGIAVMPGGALGNCGDGTLDTYEECDDGNTADGDCCNSGCILDGAGAGCSIPGLCSLGEECDGAGICLAGDPLSCDDTDACTTDSCDPVSDTCGFVSYDLCFIEQDAAVVGAGSSVMASVLGGTTLWGGLDATFADSTGGTFDAELYLAMPADLAELEGLQSAIAAIDFFIPTDPALVWDLDFNGGFSSVTMTFAYNDTALLPGFMEEDLAVYHFDNGVWTKLPGVLDTNADLLTVTTPDFSLFALGATEFHHPTLVPSMAPWGLMVLVLCAIATLGVAATKREPTQRRP